MIIIKICGITNLEDAMAALACGANAIGFNFYPESPRYIDPEDARKIALEIPSPIWKAGVFVNAKPNVVRCTSEIVGLDILQFHGDETPYYCEQFATPWWKAFRLRDERTLQLMSRYRPDAFLLDTYKEGVFGGTGIRSNWDLAIRAKGFGKVALAGGLDLNNVEKAIATVDPWAIDVCSGVESEPGKKDHKKMKELVDLARLVGQKVSA